MVGLLFNKLTRGNGREVKICEYLDFGLVNVEKVRVYLLWKLMGKKEQSS
jgi:hypothetical protein